MPTETAMQAPATANAAGDPAAAWIHESSAGEAAFAMRMIVRNEPFTRPRSAAGTSRCLGTNTYTTCAAQAV